MSLGLGTNYGKLGAILAGGTGIGFSAIGITDASSAGTVVGTAYIKGSHTGTPVWALTANASGTYTISSNTGVVTILSTTNLAVETELITIHSSGTTPVTVNKSFGIVVSSVAPSPGFRYELIFTDGRNSMYTPIV